MKSYSQPTVTIIVPVYKVEKYLSRCVDSILNQSYPYLEIILVDDGSPDRCPAICDDYRRKDERIKVIHKKNGGLSSARNAGMRAAGGNYFCFVDSDDYIQSDMIEQLVTAAQLMQVPISVCGFTSDAALLQRGVTEEIKLYSASEAIREILLDRTICTSACAKLFDRSLFDDICFPEGMLYEDYGSTYKLIHKAGKLAFVDMKKYFYTYNPSGITKSAFSAKQMDYFCISDEIAQFVAENYPELKPLVFNRATNMAVSLFRKLALTPGNARFAAEEKKLVEIIRKDSFGFLSSSYPVTKKLSCLAISIFPNLTMNLFEKIFPGNTASRERSEKA